jgi:hypothetical protein
MLNIKLLFLLSLSFVGILTEVGWDDIDETGIKIRFSFPSQNLNRIDEDSIIVYTSLTEDSLVSSQAFIFKNYSLAENEELSDYMFYSGQSDTLDAIAQYMISIAEGDLVYFEKPLNTSSIKTLDLGIRSIEIVDNDTLSSITFTRFHLQENRAVVLNLFAQEAFLNELILARNKLWNSLDCY